MTRNVRLAAIKSFYRFLEYRQPAALEHVRRVLAIPFKKTDQRLVPYLLREELDVWLPVRPASFGEYHLVPTPRTAGIDVLRTSQTAALDASVGRIAGVG